MQLRQGISQIFLNDRLNAGSAPLSAKRKHGCRKPYTLNRVGQPFPNFTAPSSICRGSRRSREPSLKPRPDPQEHYVQALQHPQDGRQPRCFTEWSQHRDGAPHRCEGRRSRYDRLASLLRMKPRQQFGAINRTGCILAAHVLKVNGTPLIQPPEQGHLTDTERTCAIEPDREPGCLCGGITQLCSVDGWRRVQENRLRSGVILALCDSSTAA